MGIWVGRYSMVGGQVQEHGPWLVEHRRVRDDESVRLLVMTEPVDDRSAEFCHEIADAVAALFRRESLSLTGGVLRALRQANANLTEWNRRSLREHRIAVGVTCVAIREGEATVAQVGPGAIYVRADDAVRRLTTEGGPAAIPLGGGEAIEPLFHRVPLASEQLLLLTSSVDDAIGFEAIAQSLALGPERALADLFLRTRELRDMSAAFVAELDSVVEDDSPQYGVAPGASVIHEEQEAPPEPARAASVDSGRDRPPAAPARRRPLTAVRRPRSAQLRGERGRALPWRALAVAAVVVTLLGLGAWTFLPALLEEDRDSRLQESLAAAALYLDGAAGAEDPVAAREQLQLAQEAIAQARAIEAADPRVAELEARAAAAAAAQDRVIEVEALRTVIEFEGTLTAPLAPSALAAGGDRLWLLDAERGRVFALDPAGVEAAEEVYRAGEDYGGTTGQDPIAITWDQQGRRLLLIDTGRTLFELAPGVPAAPLPLRGAAELRSLDAVAAYAGNLYILDPMGGEVWRYLPAAGGFDSERSGLLGGVELPGAVDLAVDGDVFVLDPGGVRHFRLSEELEPLLRGADRPPESPAAIVEDVLRGRFYIADRGGRRILVSDRDGVFLAQYRHPAFFDLRGLALGVDGTTLYPLTGEGVFAFDPLLDLAGQPAGASR